MICDKQIIETKQKGDMRTLSEKKLTDRPTPQQICDHPLILVLLRVPLRERSDQNIFVKHHFFYIIFMVAQSSPMDLEGKDLTICFLDTVIIVDHIISTVFK